MKTIEKPWGKEEIIEFNDKYMVKRLTMLKGHRCSLQYHNVKLETIYVIRGKLKIYYGQDSEKIDFKIFSEGEGITLRPGQIHRMEGIEDSIYLEASTPEMDDVIRLSDDYNRKTE